MTLLKLRYVQRFRDRHGKTRHYFRRPGHIRVALPGLPGSAEFMATYQQCLTGEARRDIGASKTKPGSLNALIVSYYRSAEFAALARSTQSTRRNILESLRPKFGHLSVSAIEQRHVRALMDAKAATPEAANNFRRVFRSVMTFAVDREMRATNPTDGVRKIRTKSDGFRTWSEADIEKFECFWGEGTRERLALYLLLYTAQRRADVVVLGWQHIQGQVIHVRQQKTSAVLAIPIHPILAHALAQETRRNLTILSTRSGKPFSPASFTNWFSAAAQSAGLPRGAVPHGLRKAAARRLAEAGCTAHMIMAITGHKTLKEIARYTAAVEQRQLAEAALERLPRRRFAIET